MERVLLAIEGIVPDRKTFIYAVQFCQRIRAELSILQILRPRNYGQYVKKIQDGAHHVKSYIEGSMMAATFAEAGEHEMGKEVMANALKSINQLVPESEKAGISCHLAMKSGDPDREIVNYVNDHRDIILTIYDAPKEEEDKTAMAKEKRAVLRGIREGLSTPFVIMREQSSTNDRKNL